MTREVDVHVGVFAGRWSGHQGWLVLRAEEALEKSHPSVIRARLVAEVVEAAKRWNEDREYQNVEHALRDQEAMNKGLQDALARLASHDAGTEGKT